jgi:hypothetical protein
MTSDGLGEMFEGDSADKCRKFPLVLVGGRAEGLACADPGARIPIFSSLTMINKIPEGVEEGFRNFEWANNSQK